MPKKFQGENTKATAARTRKAGKAANEKALREKEIEDAYWKEDDKLISKKIQRKEVKELKKQSEVQKRQERKLLEEEEAREPSLKSQTQQKITVYQLQRRKEEDELATQKQNQLEVNKSHLDSPLIENLNRCEVDVISASGLDEAVAALSINDKPADRHPERRMAAAFRAFEEKRSVQLKKENPNMRLSQLKQLLRKEWQRSPQNPLNQSHEAFNATSTN